MINPIIYSFGNFSLHWYGVIVMAGVIVGSLIAERELIRRGGNGDTIWDVLVGWTDIGRKMKFPWGTFQFGLPLGVLPVGIIGARLWYVMNATLGGNRLYIENPSEIVRVWNGGLHIFGGFLFGAISMLLLLKKHKVDAWMVLDSIGPALLIGQGIGRLGNFINQELYGPPTTLPWGLKISTEYSYQIPLEMQGKSSAEVLSYLESTRFHPTFAYEMLWNFAAAGFLLWLSRRYEKDFKPGTLFAGWLLLAGIGRTWIELFRPDQPKIGETDISYSMVIAALMAIGGAIMLMARYKAINLKVAENWEEEYQMAGQAVAVMAKAAFVKKPANVKLSVKPASKTKSRTKTAARKPKKPASRSAK
jgi:phosphatidylglycerol:prolipoprotein diacylglycerol transferase